MFPVVWEAFSDYRQGSLELTRVEIDTNHFKGNYPDSCMVEGTLAPGAAASELAGKTWTTVLPQTKLKAHFQHRFSKLAAAGPFSHLRVNIYPDGGVSRFHAFGVPAKP